LKLSHHRYSIHYHPDGEYISQDLYQGGNNAWLYGGYEDDLNTIDIYLNKVEEKEPEAVILGGLAYSDIPHLRMVEG
jgi:hypothetical protein